LWDCQREVRYAARRDGDRGLGTFGESLDTFRDVEIEHLVRYAAGSRHVRLAAQSLDERLSKGAVTPVLRLLSVLAPRCGSEDYDAVLSAG